MRTTTSHVVGPIPQATKGSKPPVAFDVTPEPIVNRYLAGLMRRLWLPWNRTGGMHEVVFPPLFLLRQN